MCRILLILAATVFALPASAALVEVPDDYLMINPSIFGEADLATWDMVQSATAPHPVADRVALVWTFDLGTGPREVALGVLDANSQGGEALVQMDDTEGFVRDPAVAYDEGTGQWLAVWAQEHAPGAYEIYGRLVYPDGTMNAAPIRITTTGADDLDPAFDALQPTVASNGAGEFLVGWAADDDAFGLVDGQFDIFLRSVDARTEALGPVTQYALVEAGWAATQPALEYLYAADSWVLTFEQDTTADPAVYTPVIYGYVFAAGAIPRAATERVELSLDFGSASRRASSAARNPAVAVDRLNQTFSIVWDETAGGAATARLVVCTIWDQSFGLLYAGYCRDLDTEGYAPSAYVRDPAVTHSRISDSFVVAWRESLNPGDGSGQTLMIAEINVASAGVVTAPFPFVNQPLGGGLAEFGPPHIEAGWRNNGRTVAIWESDARTPGYMENFGQSFDLAAVVDAPPAKTPREFAVRIAPNPFNPRTVIALALPVSGRASVDIYDVRGRLVRKLINEDLPAGDYSRTWDGIDDGGQRVSSGVYLVKVRHPSGQRVTKVALVE